MWEAKVFVRMLLNKRDFVVEVHVLWNEHVAKKLDVSISRSDFTRAYGIVKSGTLNIDLPPKN